MKPRPASESDAEGVAALLAELGYPTTAAEARQRLRETLADPGACVLVVDEPAAVVALLAARESPYFPSGAKLLRVTALVVAASHRRRGIGRLLLERVVEHAASRGCAAVELTTGERRTEAHSFYEQIGFKRTSFRYLLSVQ